MSHENENQSQVNEYKDSFFVLIKIHMMLTSHKDSGDLKEDNQSLTE